jgi:hypothetical protein
VKIHASAPSTQPHTVVTTGDAATHSLPPLNLRTVGSLPKWAPAWNELESTIIKPLQAANNNAQVDTTTANSHSASSTSKPPTNDEGHTCEASHSGEAAHHDGSGAGSSKTVDAPDLSHIVFLKSSSNHLIDVQEKVYVRVWTSRREAKKFVRGMAAVTQALHTLHLPTCIVMPVHRIGKC